MREWESASKQGSKQGTVTHNQSLPTETGPAFSPLEQCPLTVVAGLVALVVVVVSLLGSEDGEGDVGEEKSRARRRRGGGIDNQESGEEELKARKAERKK